MEELFNEEGKPTEVGKLFFEWLWLHNRAEFKDELHFFIAEKLAKNNDRQELTS